MVEIANADQARAELEQARDEFRALVLGLSGQEWDRKSRNGAWTNGQLCWHIAFTAGGARLRVSRLRQNQGLNPPGLLMSVGHFSSEWIVRIRSRGATPESVLALFDERVASSMAVIDSVGDDEWDNGAEFLGEQMTVGSSFGFLREHISEHAAEMQRGARH